VISRVDGSDSLDTFFEDNVTRKDNDILDKIMIIPAKISTRPIIVIPNGLLGLEIDVWPDSLFMHHNFVHQTNSVSMY